MSLIDTLPAPTVASEPSIALLVSLLTERGVEIEASAFVGVSQSKVSTMIDVENDRPASDEQLARVAELVKRLGIPGTVTTKNREQARRQIKTMEADLARIRAATRARNVSPEAKDEAEAFLNDLLGSVKTATAPEAEPVAEDDIPF